ncbi:DNA repair protein RecN, partial [Pseudomonas aeruginosa]|nr:DNA repair protein RecN [Pseudomonas aeruginosa]
ELADLQQRLFDELEALNADDEAVGRLGDELAAYARHYQEKAEELSRLRQAAAAPLAASVEQEMQRLGMPGVGADQELHAFQSVGLRLGAVAGMQDDGEAPPG